MYMRRWLTQSARMNEQMWHQEIDYYLDGDKSRLKVSRE